MLSPPGSSPEGSTHTPFTHTAVSAGGAEMQSSVGTSGTVGATGMALVVVRDTDAATVVSESKVDSDTDVEADNRAADIADEVIAEA